MVGHGGLGALSRLHAFPKPDASVVQSTVSGGIVTLVGVVTVGVLFLHELHFFLTPSRAYKMSVDTTRGSMLPIHFDITFPAMPCPALSLSTRDASGNIQPDVVSTDVLKVRLSRSGHALGTQRIGDLRQASTTTTTNVSGPGRELIIAGSLQRGGLVSGSFDLAHLEDTVRAMKEALSNQEGCRLSGQLTVRRIAGSLQVSVHSDRSYVLHKVFRTAEHVNLSHTIRTLGFGMLYPGIENPLDGFQRTVDKVHTLEGVPTRVGAELNKSHARGGGDVRHSVGAFKYYLKVVPTTYKSIAGEEIFTNQYSVSEYFHEVDPKSSALSAGVMFHYDISSITVTIEEARHNFFHFLTRLCAVLGGAFALTGMLDRAVFSLIQSVASKPQKGRGTRIS